MTGWLRRQLPSLLILLLVGGAGAWLLMRPAAPLPGLELALADGGRLSLAAQRGRPLVILLWSPGCGICRDDAGRLADLAPELERRGAALLVIESGAATAPDPLPAYPLALDPERRFLHASGDRWAPPATLLVDRKGRVREHLRGALDPARILAWLTTQ